MPELHDDRRELPDERHVRGLRDQLDERIVVRRILRRRCVRRRVPPLGPNPDLQQRDLLRSAEPRFLRVADQRLTWTDDTFENIMSAFEAWKADARGACARD